MVDILTIIALLLGGILCIVVPLGLFWWISRKANKLVVPAVAGILGFFVMQIIIRLPLLQLTLPNYQWYQNLSPVALGLFLAFTAGLFETVGRFWSIKLFMKEDSRFSAGFAHGIGHGGVEAVLLVGLNFIIYAGLAVMINVDLFDQLLALGSEEELNLLKDVLVYTKWYEFLWGTLERMFTIVIHIGLSVIMVYGFHRKKRIFFGVVLGLHTIFDFIVIRMSQNGLSLFWIEFFILCSAILMVIIIKLIYNEYKKESITDRKEEAYD